MGKDYTLRNFEDIVKSLGVTAEQMSQAFSSMGDFFTATSVDTMQRFVDYADRLQVRLVQQSRPKTWFNNYRGV